MSYPHAPSTGLSGFFVAVGMVFAVVCGRDANVGVGVGATTGLVGPGVPATVVEVVAATVAGWVPAQVATGPGAGHAGSAQHANELPKAL